MKTCKIKQILAERDLDENQSLDLRVKHFGFFRYALIFLIVLGSFLFFTKSASAATYYVSPDGLNTAPYDTWAKAATTIQTGFNATASAGDIVEIDGGISGITYNERVLTCTGGSAGIIMKGSTEEGHNGTVTIAGTGTSDDVLYTGQNMTFENLTFDNQNDTKSAIRGCIGTPILIFNNCVFKDSDTLLAAPGTITVNNSLFTGNTRSTSAIQIVGSLTINYSKIDGITGYVYLDSTDNFTANNDIFIGHNGSAIWQNSASSVLNIENSIFVANDGNFVGRDVIQSSSGTNSVSYSLLQPSSYNANTYKWSGVTPANSLYTTPKWQSSRRSGVVVLILDDYQSFSLFNTVATNAMHTYGIPMTLAIDKTDSVSAAEWASMANLVSEGHSIASHTRTHPDLRLRVTGMNIQYVGTGLTATMTISDNTLSTIIDGVPDLGINLANYDINNLSIYINNLADYTASAIDDGGRNSVILADITDQDIKTAVYSAMQDDEKFFDDEISGAKSDIEAGIPGYTLIAMVPPGNATDETARDAMKDRGILGDAALASWNFETGIDIYNIYRRPYGSFDGTSETTLKNGVYAYADWTKYTGAVSAIYAHIGDWTAAEWDCALQALKDDGVTVINLDDAIQYIRDNGTEGDDEVWSKTGGFSDSSNYQLSQSSSLIDAGTDVSLTSDYAGNPIYGTPDIGAYEYQPPYSMGTDGISTSAVIRTYGDEKFRNKTATSSVVTADLSITLPGADRTQWLDVEISTWDNTGVRQKTWTASSTVSGLTNTVYAVGDLEANKYYNVQIDNVLATSTITGDNCSNGVCLSNSSGKITFTYTGTYSDHTFDIIQDTTPPNDFSLATVGNTYGGGIPSGWNNPPEQLTNGFSVSIEEIKQKIAEILEKVSQLKAQIQHQQLSEIPADYKFTTDIKYSQESDDVKYLQIFLKSQGASIYPEGIVSGWFGPLTKKAVIRFQEKYAKEILAPWGLTKGTGFVGKTTKAKLDELMMEQE